mmetsp:Transcript_33314/g.52395  ORF Transcript_33314/g.52395 Transcript_33314/m.52395 type:complete len:91 (+) Transcript_33314:1390-1662(+)
MAAGAKTQLWPPVGLRRTTTTWVLLANPEGLLANTQAEVEREGAGGNNEQPSWHGFWGQTSWTSLRRPQLEYSCCGGGSMQQVLSPRRLV